MDNLKTPLLQGAQALGIHLEPQQVQQLLDYVALLYKWNQAYNLTAVRQPEAMLVKHILDSLAVVPYIKGDRLLDVGTGSGIPGIVLAIVWPERQFDLLDSNIKKIRFVRQAVRTLGLTNVQAVHARVESWQPEACYDSIVSRAFAELALFVKLTRHLLCKEGCWWAMKAHAEAEQALLPNGIQVVDTYELTVPGLSARRTLVVLKQEQA